MVVSIVVAVALLGVLVWLITQQEQLRSAASSAAAEKNRIQTTNNELTKKVAALSRSLGGNEKDEHTAAIKKLDDALAKVAADEKTPNKDQLTAAFGAAAIIDNLFKLYSDERAARDSSESDRDKGLKDLKSAHDKIAEMQATFAKDLTALGRKVNDLQLAKSEFERLKASDIDSLKGQISAKQDALESLRKDSVEMSQRLRAEIKNREGLLDEQKQALAMLRGPPALGASELALAREPVGQVLRALPGDSLVHIDLGKEDNVTLGMTFTVYSADERVPIDGRGKAAIEVVSLGQKTAECRVTAPPSPDDPILEGDRVGNIILAREKGRKPQFCIVGGFDVDFDGSADARGAAMLAALVTRWGGVVVDSVDANTDYLVVGTEPSMAVAAAPRPAGKPVPEEKAAAAEEPPADADDSAAEGGDDEKPAEEGAEEEGPSEEVAEAAAETKPTETPPEPPKIEKPAETDLTAEPRSRRVLNERERYELAIRRAEKFSIPRLPAERFYNFIGLESPSAAARALQQ
jgi:hypothetical protein